MDEPENYFYDLPNENVLEQGAPIHKRLFAFIIDLLLFNIFLYPPFIQVFQFVSGISSDLLTINYLLLKPELISFMLGVLAAGTIVFCFYMALSEYVFGRTIGEQLTGLWVKGEPGLWGFVERNLLKSTLIFLLPFDLLGIINYKQRFIDKALGVKVLYSKRISLTEGYL